MKLSISNRNITRQVCLWLVLGFPTLGLCQEVLFLDTYADPEPGTGFTDPVFTAAPLELGQEYEISWEGTMSLASAANWSAGTPCGAAEPSTTYPSTAGAIDGVTGMDPLYFFAVPFDFCSVIPSLPFLVPLTTMSLDGGLSFGLPDLPEPPPYNPSHVYSFTVVGQGQLAAFRYEDDFLPNNHGQFRISITPVLSPASTVPVMPLWLYLLSGFGLAGIALRSLWQGRAR